MGSNLVKRFLDFLFPPFCVHCKKIGSYLCPDCFEKIEFVENQICPECRRPSISGLAHPFCLKPHAGLDGILSVAEFKGPIRSLIHKLKYGRYPTRNVVEPLKNVFNQFLLTEVDYFLPNCLVAGVPLHKFKQNERGFNQAEVLGRIIAEILEIEFVGSVLQKTELGKPQMSLKKDARLKNIRGTIERGKNADLVRMKEVIIVDDVTTTGATLKECAKVLKVKCGAENVWAVTLARG